MSRPLLQSLARELGVLLQPISRAVESPLALDRLLNELGVVERDTSSLVGTLTAVRDLNNELEALASPGDVTLESIGAALEASRRAFELMTAIADAGSPFSEIEGFGRDLADLLLAAWIGGHPVARGVAELLTLLKAAHEQPAHPPQERNGVIVRVPFQLDRLRLDRLPDLLRNPVAVLRAEYVNTLATDDDAAAMADRLFPRVVRLLRALGVSCRYGVGPGDESLLGDAAPLMSRALIVYAEDALNGAEIEAGVVLSLSPASRGDLGLVISPFGSLTFTRQAGRWAIESALTAEVEVLAWGRHGLTLLAGTDDAEVAASFIAKAQPREEEPAYVFGASDGTRIEMGSVRLGAEAIASQAKQSLALSAECPDSALVIAPGDGDGFLRSILPAEGLQVKFDLGLAWSNDRGLTLRGSAGLDATLPVGLSVGGVLTVPTVHLRLHVGDVDLLAEASASVGVSIGPVHAVVDRVGIVTTLAFPEAGGNLGVADLDFRFKPPTGMGLTIDTPAISGSGYLHYFPERGEYIGVAQLSFKDRITVRVFGVILTEPRVSILLMVSADFPPVQLGLGFQLTEVGGLVGIHRRLDADRLLEGLRDNVLAEVLFPKGPLKDPHGLVIKINDVFPPSQGQHVFGPMGLITWGPQSLITIEIGLILEVPFSFQVRVVGVLKTEVSKRIAGKELSVLKLQVNFAGLFDLEERFIRFDASLYQSTMFNMRLDGEMALRLRYGQNPDFVVALGGFHPDFQPPALSLPPDLRRLQVTLRAGNPHIWVDAYLAVTTNTIQFGAHGHLRFKKWGVGIYGDLGFDALFQFNPFRFEASVYFILSASWKGHDFASIEIDGAFAGPSPWRIRGQFKLKICWFLKISVAIDESWGDSDETLLGQVDVMPLLLEDLGASSSWERLPGRTRLLAACRRSELSAEDLLVHPNDLLSVRQNTVPLGLHIDKFGEGRPKGASKFRIKLKGGGQALEGTALRAHFAPAQFFERGEEEKLAAKSYELFEAGAAFDGLDAVFFDEWTGHSVAYEEAYVDNPALMPREPSPPRPETVEGFRLGLLNNALANSAFGRHAKPRSPAAPFQIAEKYVVAELSTLAVHGDSVANSETEARQMLHDVLRGDPRKQNKLTVLPLFEVTSRI